MMNVGASKTRMVYVGTGRYMGESDLSNTQVQTVYGLGENLELHSDSAAYVANGYTVLPSTGLTLRQQLNQIVLATKANAVETKVVGPATTTVTTVTTPVAAPSTPVTTVATYSTTPPAASTTTTSSSYAIRGTASPVCAATGIDVANKCVGWYADLPATGERVNLDMRLVLGSLTVPTNVTNLTACDTGGNSWLNVFDAATGLEIPNSPFGAGRYMPGAVTVGISLIRGQSGRILSILTKSDDTQSVSPVQTQQSAPLGKRSGWRDLLDR